MADKIRNTAVWEKFSLFFLFYTEYWRSSSKVTVASRCSTGEFVLQRRNLEGEEGEGAKETKRKQMAAVAWLAHWMFHICCTVYVRCGRRRGRNLGPPIAPVVLRLAINKFPRIWISSKLPVRPALGFPCWDKTCRS